MISIVIPTCGHLEDCLKPCIESLIKYTDLNDVEVIVVSNHVPDGTREYVWSKGEKFQCLSYNEPIGFTKAANIGMRHAKGDYIVLLNNDTILLEQPKNKWLEVLKAPLWDIKVGATGPMMVVSPHNLREFLIFFCVMIPRHALETVGYLDEAFNPGFCEDNDWCARAEDGGLYLVQVPHQKFHMENNTVMIGDFPIYHAGNLTFKETGKTGAEGFARNIALLKQRHPAKINKAATIDGYMPACELTWLADKAKGKKRVLEIGSWHGRSTRALAENADEVWAVDTWYGSDNEPENHGSAYLLKGDHAIMEFVENNHDLMMKGAIIPIRMHSTNACALFKKLGIKFDMIFIDGDHTYEGCKNDITNVQALLEPNGLLCGHDYGAWLGVKQAVDETFSKIDVHHSIWIVKDRPKVFDCVLFYNELELLEIRLHELEDVVDTFIIIESKLTTTGNPKPLYFMENREKFGRFQSKIKHVVLETLPEGDTWVKERYARDKFKELVQGADNDIVIVSDLDEIPSAEAVRRYKPEMGLRCFNQRLYYYWLNCYNAQWDWAKIIGFKDFKNMTPCQIRYTEAPAIEWHGGWHFSFQGGPDRIMDKLAAWTHSEYNIPGINNKEWITYAINQPCDVLKRVGIPLTFVPIDSTYPKYVLDNLNKYKQWIHP